VWREHLKLGILDRVLVGAGDQKRLPRARQIDEPAQVGNDPLGSWHVKRAACQHEVPLHVNFP
jgi:hypothetical protein